MARETPSGWAWAYHVTPLAFIPTIECGGLRANMHAHVDEEALFVEPSFEGVEPYLAQGVVVLRFKTPGFASTEDGEDVLFPDDDPFVSVAGERVIPQERLQILDGNKFRWLLPESNPKRSRPDVVSLGLAEVREDGLLFKTGTPVRFPYLRNAEPSTQHGSFGSQYQQGIEPAGRFMILRYGGADPPTGWEVGTIEFRSPLVLQFNRAGEEPRYSETSWKARLRDHYRAKGRSLSRKIVADGYDGIVTVAGRGKQAGTSEIVDLTWLAAGPQREAARRLARGG